MYGYAPGDAWHSRRYGDRVDARPSYEFRSIRYIPSRATNSTSEGVRGADGTAIPTTNREIYVASGCPALPHERGPPGLPA